MLWRSNQADFQRPWQSSPLSSSFLPSPQSYRSTDKLLPLELVIDRSPTGSIASQDDRAASATSWKGWKVGARVCLLLVVVVLILNVSMTIWAANVSGVPGGIGTIHNGPCKTIRSTGLWLHIAINILSTMLLGASNYFMQALCSPTRREVDQAHRERKWLDIGIQSVKNLRSIGRLRTFLWFLFAMSSIPLHIM